MDTTVHFVDTPDGVAAMVEAISNPPTDAPEVYIALEGHDVGLHGSVSLMQLYHAPSKYTYLLDICSVKQGVFATPASNGMTLEGLLISKDITKVFYDVRNDAAALYANYRIRLQGVRDLQLMELASRSSDRGTVRTLDECMQQDGDLSDAEDAKWKSATEAVADLNNPQERAEAFNQRPLPDKLIQHSVQKVACLPGLWKRYDSKLNDESRKKVIAESQNRVSNSQSVGYNLNMGDRLRTPLGWPQ